MNGDTMANAALESDDRKEDFALEVERMGSEYFDSLASDGRTWLASGRMGDTAAGFTRGLMRQFSDYTDAMPHTRFFGDSNAKLCAEVIAMSVCCDPTDAEAAMRVMACMRTIISRALYRQAQDDLAETQNRRW